RLAGVLVRQPGAADGLPGGGRELEPAVVAVAGVGGPVASRLAFGEGVPGGVVAGVAEAATVGRRRRVLGRGRSGRGGGGRRRGRGGGGRRGRGGGGRGGRGGAHREQRVAAGAVCGRSHAAAQ